MSEYNICYSLDKNYIEQFCVSLVSILKNACAKDNINIYVLDGGLKKSDKSDIELLKNIKDFNIEYIKMESKDFSSCPMLKDNNKHYKNYHVTLPTYFRFLLPEVLPKTDKILYLDCDVIVRTSLEELFNTDIKNSPAAMVLDVETEKESKRLNIKKYFNAGVMLINLDYWRENAISTELFEFGKKHKDIILWQDQDIINCVLDGKIKELDEKWNFQFFLYDKVKVKSLSDTSILHLSGRFKPWLMPFEHPVYDCYYYYLTYTKYAPKILEYRQNSFGKSLKNNIGGTTTNILINATDEDLKKLYGEVNKIYGFTNESVEYLKKRLDEEVPQIYTYVNETLEKKVQEVSIKSYDNINKSLEEKTQQVCDTVYSDFNNAIEKKTKEICESIYSDFNNAIEKKTKEVCDSLYSNINETIEGGIQKSCASIYENVNKTVKSSIEETCSSIYDNVNKTIENAIQTTCASIYDNVNKMINDRITEAMNSIYDNINKAIEEKTQQVFPTVYDYVNEAIEKKNNEINLIYEEISKNYKYTEKIVAELRDELTK